MLTVRIEARTCGAGIGVAGVGVAKRQGLWAEIQRERAARQERIRQREFREFQRAEAWTVREAAKAERDRKRQAATGERVRKKLYVEDRKAEAAAMAEDVSGRLAELDGLLKAGIRDRPVVTFASLRRTDTYPAFDAGQLGEPLPPPIWEQFAQAPPSGLGKIFGGGGRFDRQADSTRAAYARAVEQHTAEEADRHRQLAEQRAAYDAAAAAFAADVAEHNAGIDQFQRDGRAPDSRETRVAVSGVIGRRVG
jgi:restriction system protein